MDRRQDGKLAARPPGRTPQPKVLKISHDDLVSVFEGNVLTLVCKAKGSPTPDIKWYKDENLITSTDGRVSVKSNNNGRLVKLKILRTSTDDTGNYTCRAENLNGFIKKWVYVAVESKVVATERPTTSTPLPSIAPADDSTAMTKRTGELVVQYPVCTPTFCLNGECTRSNLDSKMFCKCKSPYVGPRCNRLHPSSLPSQNENHTVLPECVGPNAADCTRTVDRTLTYVGIGLAGIFLLLILGISWFMARQRRKDWRVFRRKNKSEFTTKSAAGGMAFALDSSRRTSVRTVGVDVATDSVYIEAMADGPDSPIMPPPDGAPGAAGAHLPRSVSFPADIEAPPSPRASRHRFGTLPAPHANATGAGLPSGAGAHAGAGGGARPSPQDFGYHPLRSLPSGESTLGANSGTLASSRGGTAVTSAPTSTHSAAGPQTMIEMRSPPSPRLVSVSHSSSRPRKDYPRTASDRAEETEVWIKQQALAGLAAPIAVSAGGNGGSGGSDSGVHSASNPLYSDSTGSGSMSTSGYVPPASGVGPHHPQLPAHAHPHPQHHHHHHHPTQAQLAHAKAAAALQPTTPRRCLQSSSQPGTLKPTKEVNFKDTAQTVTIATAAAAAAAAAHRHCLAASGFEGPWERPFAGLPGFVTFSNTQQERVCICPSHVPNGPVMAPPPPRLTTFAQHSGAANTTTNTNTNSLPNHRPY